MADIELIAWSPSTVSTLVRVGAILCSPMQSMDRDMYLNLLGDRIQRMIDLSDDPDATAREFAQTLDDRGLWYPGPLETDKVGNWLVWSNPAVNERLDRLGLLSGLSGRVPVEMTAAREQIDVDAEDPHSRLLSWASLLLFTGK